jgi:hypothetical protein
MHLFTIGDSEYAWIYMHEFGHPQVGSVSSRWFSRSRHESIREDRLRKGQGRSDITDDHKFEIIREAIGCWKISGNHSIMINMAGVKGCEARRFLKARGPNDVIRWRPHTQLLEQLPDWQLFLLQNGSLNVTILATVSNNSNSLEQSFVAHFVPIRIFYFRQNGPDLAARIAALEYEVDHLSQKGQQLATILSTLFPPAFHNLESTEADCRQLVVQEMNDALTDIRDRYAKIQQWHSDRLVEREKMKQELITQLGLPSAPHGD